MTGKTHILGGVVAGAAVQYFGNVYTESLTFLGVCAIGAMLPDICHSGSKIGRKLPALSRAVSTLFGHRTITHSLLFFACLGGLLLKLPVSEKIVVGILVGVGSHLVLDALTARGIQLFWPVRWKVRFPLYTHTGGAVENILFAGLFVALVYLGGHNFF